MRVRILTNSFAGILTSPPVSFAYKSAYSEGVLPAGPFLSSLSSPSSITKLDPPSLLVYVFALTPDGPVGVLGAPSFLSTGPGVLIPNTLLGTSRLALELLGPLTGSSIKPCCNKRLYRKGLTGFKYLVGLFPEVP